MCGTGSGGRIGGEETPRSNWLTVGDHELTQSSNSAQQRRRLLWSIAQLHRECEPRSVVVIEAAGDRSRPACEAHSGEHPRQLVGALIKINNEQRVVVHQRIHCDEKSCQRCSDHCCIIGLKCGEKLVWFTLIAGPARSNCAVVQFISVAANCNAQQRDTDRWSTSD